MATEIKVPAVGESISEVLIGEWYVNVGDWVKNDTELVGLETDKATFEVPAPFSGELTEILVKAGETAAVGDVIAYFEKSKKPADAPEKDSKSEADQPEPVAAAATSSASSSHTSGPNGPATSDEVFVMPAAARLLHESGLRPEDVTGTGPGGRILKEDVLKAQATQKGETTRPMAVSIEENLQGQTRSEEVRPMSPIRKRIAERLVNAQQQAALLTTFNEVDMSAVMALRKQYQDEFIKRHEVKLGFMSFFVKAVVEALKAAPQVSAQIRGDELVYPNYYDIGVAVGGGKGLVVPIIRNAERLSFAEIEKTIGDFGKRAQANKIGLDEMEGGCFTISNGGIYGSMLSTPIVNPPQSGILGMHNIQQRPVVVDGEIVARPMMYLALTYDHRIVDGREAVTFLVRIKEAIENPTRILIEI